MPVQMIELEEVSMMDLTDDVLESQQASPALPAMSSTCVMYPLTVYCC
jgi:hypothetical protein